MAFLAGCSTGMTFEVSDDNDDDDGDGFTNSEEVAAGTDPLNPNDYPSSKETTSEDAIQKPTWKVGDSWSMGETIDLSDMGEDMKKSFEWMDAKINRFEYKGEIGVYQSAKVIKDNAEITIGSTTYKCYEVSFEQYVGMAMSIYIDLEIEMPDYSDYEDDDWDDDEYYTTRASTSALDSYSSMKMRQKAYVWLKADLTGSIYYTVDELAVAKGMFEMKMDGNMDMDITASMEGEGTISMDMKYDFDNIYAKYDVVYDPPLDIFNFPIEPDESWSASSKMTQTLHEMTGKLSYSMSMVSPDYPSTSMDDEIDFSNEISTPDTYGPVTVRYYFSNSGIKSLTLANGISSECIIIEPDENYWYNDYGFMDDDSDGYSNGTYEYEESSSSSIMPSFSIPGMDETPSPDDFDAESLDNPIETTAGSTNYYSEDEGNIVSLKPSEDDSGDSFYPSTSSLSSSDEQSRMESLSYDDVTTFKTQGREDMKNKYPNIAVSGGDNEDEASNWTIIFIVMTVVFIALIITGMVISNSKKKRQTRYAAYDRFSTSTTAPASLSASASTPPPYPYTTPSVQAAPASIPIPIPTQTQAQTQQQQQYQPYPTPTQAQAQPQPQAQNQYRSNEYYQGQPSQTSPPREGYVNIDAATDHTQSGRDYSYRPETSQYPTQPQPTQPTQPTPTSYPTYSKPTSTSPTGAQTSQY